MAKPRVYELARELNMTNKDLLGKIQEMGIEVKSHVSSLDDSDIARIKEELFGPKEKPEVVEEVRVRQNVIRRRRKPKAEEAVPETEEAEMPSEAAQADVSEPVSGKAESAAEPVPSEKEEEAAPPAAETSEEATPTEPETVVEPEEEAEAEPEAAEEASVAEPEEEAVAEPETVEADEPAAEPVETEKAEAQPEAEAGPEQPEAAQAPSQPEAEPEAEKAVKPKKAKKKTKKSTPAKIISLPEALPEESVEEKAEPQEAGSETPSETETGADKKRFKKKKAVEIEADQPEKAKKFAKKKSTYKKKEIIEGDALYDQRFGRVRKGRKKSKIAKPIVDSKTQITVPKAIKRRIKIDDTIVLGDLAKRMGIKANELIRKLIDMGMMVTMNQPIDFDTAALLATEFNFEVEKAAFEEESILKTEADAPEQLQHRPPVVTIMGHVDHGKTSLLDVIRRSKITEKEAGGITQHIGAYHVPHERGSIVFLDTPGHEAFTAMRARGAKVTDIVVLVVAADDGVMPQTVEAIDHSRAAEVPIIVAVNKIDKPEAEPDRIKRELSEKGLVPEDWGGDTIFVNVSAKKEIGIDELLEMILLQAEVQELKANPNKLARGYIVESKMDTGRGPVATVLISEGTLHTGEAVVSGMYHGKVRAMFNDQGTPVKEAGPSMPVEILGLSGVPMAGDEFMALTDEKDAKQVSEHRLYKQRSRELAKTSRMSLDKLYERMQEGDVKELNLIIKADVQGSIEALKDSLTRLSTDEVKISVIHSATGTIHESDISLAAVSNAIILGFNVRAGGKVSHLAEEENVDIRYYNVIYNAIKDIKDAMVGLMESRFEEKVLGRAEVRQVFTVPNVGAIAGCYVMDGKIQRGQPIRLLRDGIIIHEGKISSLRRFKDDVKEVAQNYECGIGIEKYNDIKVGDVIECYFLEEIKPVYE